MGLFRKLSLCLSPKITKPSASLLVRALHKNNSFLSKTQFFLLLSFRLLFSNLEASCFLSLNHHSCIEVQETQELFNYSGEIIPQNIWVNQDKGKFTLHHKVHSEHAHKEHRHAKKHKVEDPSIYIVSFSKGSSGSYQRYLYSGPHKIFYQIFSDSSKSFILRETVDFKLQHVLSVNCMENPKASYFPLNYFLHIYPGQSVPAGKYVDDITIQLQQLNIVKKTLFPLFSRNIRYYLDVPAYLKLSLEQNKKQHSIHLSDLETGETHSFSMNLQCNTRCNLSISTKNHCSLLHAQSQNISSAISSEVIPFELTCNQKKLSFNAEGKCSELYSNNENRIVNKKFNFQLKLKDTKNKKSGEYRETLYFTARAVE